MDNEFQVKTLKENLHKLIEEYRNAVQTLTNPPSGFTGIDNYSCPTQIEVFWLKEPPLQWRIITHLSDRPDKEIIVNGPWERDVFEKETSRVLSHKRWNASIRDLGSRTLGELAAGLIRGMIHIAKESYFDSSLVPEPKVGSGGAKISFEDGFWEIATDLLEEGYHERIQESIRRIEEIHNFKPSPTKPIVPDVSDIRFYRSVIWPPLTFDTHKDYGKIVRGEEGFSSRELYSLELKPIHSVTFAETGVSFYEHGIIDVFSDQKELALQILNTINGVFLINGIEVVETRDKRTVVGGNGFITMVWQEDIFSHLEPRSIPIRRFIELVDLSSKAFELLGSGNGLIQLTKSYTHLNEGLYPESVIASWKIIEDYMERLYLTSFNSKEHLDMQKKMWRLYEAEKLPMDYNVIDNLRRVRNSALHRSEPVQKSDVIKCFEQAKRIVNQELVRLIQSH